MKYSLFYSSVANLWFSRLEYVGVKSHTLPPTNESLLTARQSREKEPDRSFAPPSSLRLYGDLLQDVVPLGDVKLVRTPVDTGPFNTVYKLDCIKALSELQTLISKIPNQKLKADYILTALSELI